MKKEDKILVVGLAAICLLDTIGSITSRELNFNYSLLSFVTFTIYGTVGFLVTREKNLITALLYGAILGIFDSTVGLKISMLLEANTGDVKMEMTTAVWIIIVVLMMGTGALVALIGGGIAKIIKKGGTNASHKL